MSWICRSQSIEQCEKSLLSSSTAIANSLNFISIQENVRKNHVYLPKSVNKYERKINLTNLSFVKNSTKRSAKTIPRRFLVDFTIRRQKWWDFYIVIIWLVPSPQKKKRKKKWTVADSKIDTEEMLYWRLRVSRFVHEPVIDSKSYIDPTTVTRGLFN